MRDVFSVSARSLKRSPKPTAVRSSRRDEGPSLGARRRRIRRSTGPPNGGVVASEVRDCVLFDDDGSPLAGDFHVIFANRQTDIFGPVEVDESIFSNPLEHLNVGAGARLHT